MTSISSKIIRASALVSLLIFAQGCFLTKVLSVPMRVGAALVSVVPIAVTRCTTQLMKLLKLLMKSLSRI